MFNDTKLGRVNLSLVLLPTWLCNMLESRGMRATHALDLHSLRRILSVRDIAFYVAVNRFIYDSLPEAFKNTFLPVNFNNADFTLPSKEGDYPDRQDVEDTYRRVNNIIEGDYALEENRPTMQHLLDILPHNELVPFDKNTLSFNQLNFEMEMMEDNVFGLKFSLKNNKQSPLTQTIQSYDTVLRLLVGLYGLQTIAESSFFSEYVKITRTAEE